MIDPGGGCPLKGSDAPTPRVSAWERIAKEPLDWDYMALRDELYKRWRVGAMEAGYYAKWLRRERQRSEAFRSHDLTALDSVRGYDDSDTEANETAGA